MNGGTSPVAAHYREAGSASGPHVLCIHPSSSSSAQWRSLMAQLAPRFRVRAVDIYGHGKSPRWIASRDLTLADEVALLKSALPGDESVNLVGHSYGGAIAVKVARMYPGSVASLMLYEPALWGTLARECPDDPATRELKSLRDETVALIDAGAAIAAAERFVDYWAGAGGWSALSEDRRKALVEGMPALRSGWTAVLADRPSLRDLNDIEVPWFLLTGTRSNRPARKVIQLLGETLSGAEIVEFDGLGHLGPITHAQVIDAAVVQFLARLQG
jgi:pimeloyl-ACP methyl ester carboxylesterase